MNFTDAFKFWMAGKSAALAFDLIVLGVLILIALAFWASAEVSIWINRQRPRGPLSVLLALALGATATAGIPTPDELAALARRKGVPEITLPEAGADPADPASVALAAQAAFDALGRADLPPGLRNVVAPDGSWPTDRMVFTDVDGVGMIGPGTLTPAANRAHPVLVAIRRIPKGGKPLSVDHYPDAAGKLDGTAGPRRGLRLLGDSTLVAWSSPWNLGPPEGWPSATAVTLDVALDTDAGPIDRVSICGASRRGVPAPLELYGRGGKINLAFELVGEPGIRILSAPLPPPGGVRRITAQLDLARGTGMFLIDRVRVAASPGSTGSAFPPGSKLVENEGVPFRIGSSGEQATTYAPDFWDGTGDLCLLGLHLSRVARYADVPAGAGASRLDGGDLSDRRAYFTADRDTVGLLTLDDDPAQAAATRSASCITGLDSYGWKSCLLFLDKLHQSEYNVISGLRFGAGLGLAGRGRYGALLTLGQTLNCTVDGLSALGGANALGTPCATTNYTTGVARSALWGADCAVDAFFGIMNFDDCRFLFAGRSGVFRFRKMRVNIFRGLIERPWTGPPVRRLALCRDSNVYAADFVDDLESTTVPTEALWDCVAVGGGSTRNSRLLLDRFTGDLPRGVPLARLAAEGPARPASCRVVDPELGGLGPIVDTAGGWSVTLDTGVEPTVGPPVDRTRGRGLPIRCLWPMAGDGPPNPADTPRPLPPPSVTPAPPAPTSEPEPLPSLPG